MYQMKVTEFALEQSKDRAMITIEPGVLGSPGHVSVELDVYLAPQGGGSARSVHDDVRLLAREALQSALRTLDGYKVHQERS